MCGHVCVPAWPSVPAPRGAGRCSTLCRSGLRLPSCHAWPRDSASLGLTSVHDLLLGSTKVWQCSSLALSNAPCHRGPCAAVASTIVV